MKRSFTPLALTVCALLFASLAQSQAPLPTGPLRIVDSAGTNVGQVIDTSGGGYTVSTAMRVGSLLIHVGVRANSLYGYDDSNMLFFESNNCRGQAYVGASDPGSLFSRAAIVGSQMSLYGLASGSTAAAHTMNSQLDINGTCSIRGLPNPPIVAVGVEKIVDLRDYFTPPFALQEAVAPVTTASVPMLGWPELALLSLLIVATLFILRRKGRAKPAS